MSWVIAGSTLGSAAISGLAGYFGSRGQADAANSAAQLQYQGNQNALGVEQQQFNQQQQNNAPWQQAGQNALGQLQHLSNNYQPFDASMMTSQDPGYAFRLSEGIKAVQAAASARGDNLSGSTLKGINDYAQNTASQEYQNAFNNYQTNRNAQLAPLETLAGYGQNANQMANQSSQNYANNAGNTMAGSANALAGGQIGVANANASGLVGGANALNSGVSSYLNYNQSNNLLNALRGTNTGSRFPSSVPAPGAGYIGSDGNA